MKHFKLKTTMLAVVSSLLLSSHTLAADTDNEAEASDTAQSSVEQAKAIQLPNPLTLESLLNTFSERSPSISLQQAKIEAAESLTQFNQVDNSLKLNLEGRLGRREFGEEDQPHNLLALHVGKVLYDFNRNEHQLEADTALYEKEQLWLKEVKNLQRLDIVKAYLNVLLSDFQYRIDNEQMAIDYINFDKVQDRHKIGQLSDVDLLEAEHNYQQSLFKRMQSEQAQLKTRVELANTLDLPNARPDELEFPALKNFKSRSLKDVSLAKLQQKVLEANPQIKTLELQQQAQESLILKAQSSGSPVLRGDAWVGQLSSQPEVRDGRWRAEITLDVPLYDGGAEKSEVAIAKAELMKLKAQQAKIEQTLRSQVADIFFQLKLLATEEKVHQAFGDYADLYLDYSRALYENESKTDLGDSFVRLSQANYNMVAWQFKQALLWLELDYLLGHSVSLDKSAEVLVVADSDKK